MWLSSLNNLTRYYILYMQWICCAWTCLIIKCCWLRLQSDAMSAWRDYLISAAHVTGRLTVDRSSHTRLSSFCDDEQFIFMSYNVQITQTTAKEIRMMTHNIMFKEIQISDFKSKITMNFMSFMFSLFYFRFLNYCFYIQCLRTDWHLMQTECM